MEWRKTVFDGLEGYTLLSGGWRLTAVSECGPRIAFLGPEGGENVLYWATPGVSRGAWRLRGGHRVWLTRPMADESEDTYLPDNEPCGVAVEGAAITLTAPPQPVNRLERAIRIEALEEEGAFRVTNLVRNTGDLIYSGGVWSPTCINPEGAELRLPLGDDEATWDIVKLVIPRRFANNETQLDDPQVRFEGNTLVVRPMGRVCKRCVSAPKGLIELKTQSGLRFTKRSVYDRQGRYPLDGCNLAVFVGQGNWMGEMETFGVEQPIIPGQTIANTELWKLS